MKEFFKKVKLTSLAFSVLYLLFGLSLILWPNATKATIISLFGAVVLVLGIVSCINYFIYGYEPFGFISGIVETTIGILILCCAKRLANAEIFAFIFGLMFVVSSLFKMQNSFDYRRYGVKTWWVDTVVSAITLALGIVILCNPFTSERVLLIVLGSFIILDAVGQLVDLFMVSNKTRKVKRSLKDLFKKEIPDVIDGTCEEVDTKKDDNK